MSDTKEFEVNKADSVNSERLVKFIDREFDTMSDGGKKVFVITLIRLMGNKIHIVRESLKE